MNVFDSSQARYLSSTAVQAFELGQFSFFSYISLYACMV